MAMQEDTGFKTFTTAAALAAYRAVELGSDGTVNYPNANADRILGVTQNAAASGVAVTVKLITASGTFKITADSAVVAGAGGTPVYCDGVSAAGKFQSADPGGGVVTFVALEAAAGDGSVIEAVPVHP